MRVLLQVGLLAVVACRRPSPAPSDAGATPTARAPTLAASAASAGSATSKARPAYFAAPASEDAGATTATTPPPLAKVTEDLELVAVGKQPGARIVWLKAIGSRVWLSGRNLDAYADGDGALTKGPDLLKGLPYGAAHRISVAGTPPHLYAFRAKQGWTREESPEGTAFVLREGKWIQAQPLAQSDLPQAFVPWGEGALLIWADIAFDTPTYAGGKGTVVQYVSPDASVTDAKLELDPKLVTWDASSDGTTLSLLATRGGDRRDGDTAERGVWLLRGTKERGMTSIPLVDILVEMPTTRARVVETGVSAYVSPPSSVEHLVAWSTPNTAFVIGADAKPHPRDIAVGCRQLIASVLAESTLYALVNESCNGGVLGRGGLVRVTAEGNTQEVALPYLVKGPSGYRAGTAEEKGALRCEAASVVLRLPSDLWVELRCGTNPTDRSLPSVPAVVRRGHAQTPITLP